MDAAVALVVIVAVVAGWNLFVYKQSGGRMWRPLWIAFTITALAVLYVGAGALGYPLSRHERFVSHTTSAGHVIWSEVGVGLAAGLVAVHFWRKGLRSFQST